MGFCCYVLGVKANAFVFWINLLYITAWVQWIFDKRNKWNPSRQQLCFTACVWGWDGDDSSLGARLCKAIHVSHAVDFSQNRLLSFTLPMEYSFQQLTHVSPGIKVSNVIFPMQADIHTLWADMTLPGTVMWSFLTSAFYCTWYACECWMPRDLPSG